MTSQGSAGLKEMTLDDILEKFDKESKNTSEKGSKFERLMKRYFQTNKIYRDRFTDVWLWKEFPGRNGEIDTGIDIVARETDGSYCGIQCKFYGPDTGLDLTQVKKLAGKCIEEDADGNRIYKSSIIVYTGSADNISRQVHHFIKKSKTSLLLRHHLRDGLDWARYPDVKPVSPKKLFPYQEEALRDIVAGFEKSDRGQLIMACGTGKTMVALRTAEELTKLGGGAGLVLYLVPSISLIVQSMAAWSKDRSPSMPQHYLSVCSDNTASGTEEGSVSEIQSPVTTDPTEITTFINKRPKDRLTVIFSTYHSIKKVIDAMRDVRKENKVFDIIFCDEAHRTTGIEKDEVGDDNDSYFTLVHDNDKIASRRRLYMTATPRVYAEKIRQRLDGSKKNYYSMDDRNWFGPVFHRLSFTKAAANGYLANFQVKIITVPADLVVEEFQESIAKNKDIPIDERSRMVGIWHALNYPDHDKAEWKASDIKGPTKLLQRVIAFTNRIDRSEMFAGDDTKRGDRSFEKVVREIKKTYPHSTKVEVRHIDGSTKAASRNEQLKWLKDSDLDKKTCRIITNARCLSEGVDVPALDGIVFLNPRKSQVDVVQAVGRVMRRAEGKESGYVILPVVVPSSTNVSDALDQNEPFRVVWQVLNALKSHDENLEIEINKLILDKNAPDGKDGEISKRISISVMGLGNTEYVAEIFDKMKSKLVEKAGWQYHYDDFGRRLGKAARTVEMRIKSVCKGSREKQKEIGSFTSNLKALINDSVTEEDAIRIISHHVILSRVFNILFSGEFSSHNPLSVILDEMAKKFGMDEELEELEDAGFYSRVQREVEGIKTKAARQNLIKAIYGSFLSATDKKGSDKHGVVYTPVEIIDFIIRSVDEILDREFGLDFNQRAVKVFDPFAGTGTFLARLLESGLITRDNLYTKYKHDIFANEIFLLAYYIATVNIETSYQSIQKRYVPFEGISYTDTLKHNPRYRMDPRFRREELKLDESFKDVHKLIRRQRWAHVHVIMGNPPYSAGQKSFDDDNPNVKYDDLDKRIEETYVKRSVAVNKNSLYDSYIRSIRWASDRLNNSGIIAFITNASFLKADAAAGLRACLAEEFNEIWCFDLRGNQRTQGEVSRSEGGKIFGAGSRAPTAITFLVKNPRKKGCTIHYKDIGDYLSREEKLQIIKDAKSISGIKDWQIIEPDKHYDWINKRDYRFIEYMPIGSKEAKAGHDVAIFKLYARGIETGRDAWAYNSSIKRLTDNIKTHVKYCNSQNLDRIVHDPRKGKWTPGLSDRLKNPVKFNADKIRITSYRPFFKQYLYFDKVLNHRPGRMPLLFPNNDTKNIAICVPYKSQNTEFTAFVTGITPDLGTVVPAQCFPLYAYKDNKQKDNITDYALAEFQDHYTQSTKKITKKDIFYYVYGLLHHLGYKTKFANNLSKEFPHIPMAPNFWAFADAGRNLADLHLNYDTGKRHRLGKPLYRFKKFEKLSFGKKQAQKADKVKKVTDYTKLVVDGNLTFENIPEVKYRVKGRTPLEWIVDRYKVTVDEDSGIVNDPTGIDIIALVERVVHVGLESDRIIEELSKESFEPKDWSPKKRNLDAYQS